MSFKQTLMMTMMQVMMKIMVFRENTRKVRCVFDSLLIAVHCILIGIITGCTIYAMFVLEPLWTTSAEAARAWWSATPLIDGGPFLDGIGSRLVGTSMFIIITGLFDYKPFKKWYLLSGITVTLIGFVSISYLVPLEAQIRTAAEITSDAELMGIIGEWQFWNTVRMWIGIVAMLFGLRALSLSHHPERK